MYYTGNNDFGNRAEKGELTLNFSPLSKFFHEFPSKKLYF